MRRSLGKFTYGGAAATNSPSFISSAFSTSSGGGGGRGRGGTSKFQFTVDLPSNSEPENFNEESSTNPSLPGQGQGRGRGRVIPSSPILPSFSSFVNNDAAALGRGRGYGPINNTSPPLPQPRETERAQQSRHLRPRQEPKPRVVNAEDGAKDKGSLREQLSTDDKVKKAVEILSRGDEAVGTGTSTRGRSGFRGGRGGFRGRGRGRSGGRGQDRYQDSDDEVGGLYLGDPADGEKLAKKLGPEMMNKLAEGFEEMASRVLPSPMDDAYVDALHTNLMIECEPEYLMEEFGTNPDIDEKPPIALRDALEKVKPFLMSYEGIQTQEEWEEAIEETMKNVPLLQEIVDYYSGPARVTAKQQQQELERVAKTIPENTPASVKNYVNRAVLSLQSNPGWGFDKKCQFMDKLAFEVSQPSKKHGVSRLAK